MEFRRIKITYIQLLLIFVLFLAFLPMGIIYASGRYDSLMQIMHILRFFVYFTTIFFVVQKSGNFKKINSPFILYEVWCVLLMLSTYLETRSLSTTFRAIIYCGGILAIFYVIQYMSLHQNEKIFETLYGCFVIFGILNIGTVIFVPNGIFNQGWQGAMYWFGGKFTTFYMYYTCLCIYLLRKKSDKFISYIIPFGIGIGLCIRIECATGIACLLFTAVGFLIKRVLVKIRPWMLVAGVLGITLLMVLTNVIFKNNIVQQFVTNVLNRSSLLTGRVDIYQNFLQIIEGNIWFGAGYSNTVVSDNTVKGYLNAQNGLLDIVTQTGVIGLLIFIAMIYKFWKIGYTYFNLVENKIVIIFVLGFFFCSFAEVSFNYYFFLLFVLLIGNNSSAISNKSRILIKMH